MAGSRTDRIYRSILLTKFFTKGWGKPESLKRLFQFRKVMSDREQCMQLVDRDHPVSITKVSSDEFSPATQSHYKKHKSPTAISSGISILHMVMLIM